jgi:hypothetical protein
MNTGKTVLKKVKPVSISWQLLSHIEVCLQKHPPLHSLLLIVLFL